MIGALGEGLLEVGVHPGLDAGTLVRGYGGDAANAAVMAALLGAEARLLTRIGGDAAGRLLLEFWREAGVDVSAVGVDAGASTGVYLNERDLRGNHRFSYHRAGSAATALAADDVTDETVAGLDALHLTGITLSISASARAAAEQAADRAARAGARLSFTVNFRAALRPDRAALGAMARRADLVFLSTDDARALLGVDEPRAVARALAPAREIVLTDGPAPAVVLVDG
ncbi:MAG TPA: PfkB family carbohydrate kinase, partial [Capillimicrobium sp.]